MGMEGGRCRGVREAEGVASETGSVQEETARLDKGEQRFLQRDEETSNVVRK